MTVSRLVIALLACILVSLRALAADSIGLPPSVTPGALEPSRVVSPPAQTKEYYLLDVLPPDGRAPVGDEGERTFVRSIILRDVIDHPDKGVTIGGMRNLIEKFRSPVQRGVTTEGKDQETAKMAQDPRVVMLNTELSIGQLQEISSAITNYYRKNGFILAQAYVPEQKVVNGDIAIKVLEGKLGKVVVENNHLYGRQILLKPFDGDVGTSVYKQSIESGLLRLTDYPGLSVFGVFRPGTEVGGTDLVLNVKDEHWFEFDVQGDNYGSKYTGEYRLRGDFSLNNLTDAADVVNGSLMMTFAPRNGIYGALSYQRPLFDIRDSSDIGFSRNAYTIGGDLADSGISGTSTIVHLALRRSFQRGIQFNNYGLLTFARKASTLSAPINTTDKLAVLSGEYGFSSASTDLSRANSGLVKISQGLGNVLGSMQAKDDPVASRHGGSGKNAGGAFSKLEFRYDWVQRLTSNQTLLSTVSGQYSKDLLTSIEQMALGGPTSVRAFPISEFLVDSGYFGSLEWSVKAPGLADKPAFGGYAWGQLLQVAVFADIGGGTINDPTPTDRSSLGIGGVGAGLRFDFSGFSSRLDVATPVAGPGLQNKNKDMQAYVNITYRH